MTGNCLVRAYNAGAWRWRAGRLIPASMSSTVIDLSQLALPDVVEQASYESIRTAMVAMLLEEFPAFNAEDLSNVAVKVLGVCATFEHLRRADFDERAKQMLLAYATGTNLDHLGALLGVTRLTDEADTAFKARIQLAPTSFSVAGPASAYRYFALSAASTIADVSVTTPEPDNIKALVDSTLAAHGVAADIRTAMRAALDAAVWPGTVLLSLLSSQGDGTATADEIAAVEAAVADNAEVRPLTDHVVVRSAEIVPYALNYNLTLFDGPSSDVVVTASETAAATYVTTARKIGRDINLANAYAAITVAGVANAKLTSLAADLTISETQAAHCTGITATVVGRGQ
jgi:phage-related baseplate assembly protein